VVNVIIKTSMQNKSMAMKKYWKDIESKNGTGEHPEKREAIGASPYSLFDDLREDGPASRRDFLKLCGFSFAVTALASCQTRIRKAVPYVIAPLEITPGEANYYASTYMSGSDYCSIVVKTREGRPIKIEGNPASSVSMGGTGHRVQASVLDLYDGTRFKGPLKNGSPADWGSIDGEIMERLQKIAGDEGKIVLLTPTLYSPSTEAVIAGFMGVYPATEWIEYDAVSASAMLEANAESFGKQVLPDYRFDKAELVVSLGADFLGTWLSPVEYTRMFSSKRNPEQEMNRLVMFESNLSLTGSNADQRIQIKPSQEAAVLLNIYKGITKETGQPAINAPASPVELGGVIRELLAARGKSLVISGTNDRNIQLLVNEINRVLENIGNTILFESGLRTRRGIDSRMDDLVRRMQSGEVDALLMYDVNPMYTWHDSEGFENGLKKVGLTISMSRAPDETNEGVGYVCPDSHYLESWNDAEPKKNRYSLMQPVINSLFDTRQMQDTLLRWSGSGGSFYDFMNAFWAENLMPLQATHFSPVAFFDHSLQTGIFEPDIPAPDPGTETGSLPEDEGDTGYVFDPASLSFEIPGRPGPVEIVLRESHSMGEGRQANNPWLQELPDPVSRICWDNYASLSPRQAGELGLNSGDVISLENLDLPVHIQAGQAYGTIGIALGYGRRKCGKVGEGVGVNAWSLSTYTGGTKRYELITDEPASTGMKHPLAQTQTHHSMEGRALVREAGLSEFRKDPSAGNELHSYFTGHSESLYPQREYPHHHWGMAIDLSACTGCANCVIACQAENNIPVVGKEEVLRVHEMHWIRIDRYYSGDETDPEVVFQPVMCQHCDNAPCENVCPVAATNQSSEGLNQMVYNRCIGTRYCNNNCPYKVRRFNWFNYTEAGTLGGNLRDAAGMTLDLRRMVLNPDVTVRSQGVIEKCSFCIQRIQSAKLAAKAENRGLLDEELQTACSQSCPAKAIVFGDMNDPGSEISKLMDSGRRYNLLEEIYTKPSVHYLTKIRNKNA
jgi:Fe-S-cluster-containing dehydrogenase component/anaerobic selenocysteine-containing dehydrogenase